MLCCPEDPAEASRKGGKSPEGETKPPASVIALAPHLFYGAAPCWWQYSVSILRKSWIVGFSSSPLQITYHIDGFYSAPERLPEVGLLWTNSKSKYREERKINMYIKKKKTTCQPSLSFLHPDQTSHSCLHYEIWQRQKESVLQTPGCVNYPRCNQHLTEWFTFVFAEEF